MTKATNNRKQSKKHSKASKKSKIVRILIILGLLANLAFAGALIVSAYAGAINPQQSGFATILNITLPLWLVLNVLNLIFDIFFRNFFSQNNVADGSNIRIRSITE